MKNTNDYGITTPEWLAEIDSLDKREIGTWHNVAGLPPDPNYVGGIKPRLRSPIRAGKRGSSSKSQQWNRIKFDK